MPLSHTPTPFETYAVGSLRGKALDEEVTQMLEKGALEVASEDPGFYSSLFGIQRPKEVAFSHRPIHGYRFIRQMLFRMETNKSVLQSSHH